MSTPDPPLPSLADGPPATAAAAGPDPQPLAPKLETRPKLATDNDTDTDTDSEADDDGARALLGKLNKVAAPPDLASRVPALIQRRSAGRFFAKRRLADRLPLEWLSLVMLALLALIYAVLRMAPALLPAN